MSKAKTVRSKINKLARDSYAKNNNVEKLKGREGYRLRVGDYRVFYNIYDEVLVVMILDIKPRGGAYK